MLAGGAGTAARGGEYPKLKPGLVLDARGGRTDSVVEWLDGGLGKARYGGSREETFARLAQASLLLKAELSESLDARLHVNVDAEPGGDRRHSRVGPIEAFLAYHPSWSPSFNLRARAGVFFPPLSLEHPGPGWTTVYTITPSAVNSWVGEDLRATGGELTFVMGGGAHEVTAGGAVFGWNDPAGTLLAWRGWALHDRQTGLRDRLPLAPLPIIGGDGLFPLQSPYAAPGREVDHRPGFYGGGSWTWSGRLHLRGLYYDTRADMAALREGQYGWAMRFASAGARLSLPGSTEIVAQHLRGRSQMGRRPDGRAMVDVRADGVLRPLHRLLGPAPAERAPGLVRGRGRGSGGGGGRQPRGRLRLDGRLPAADGRQAPPGLGGRPHRQHAAQPPDDRPARAGRGAPAPGQLPPSPSE